MTNVIRAVFRLNILNISIDENKHIILLPGRLSNWKGHKVAISAAALIKKNHPDVGGSDWITKRLNQARDILLG